VAEEVQLAEPAGQQRDDLRNHKRVSAPALLVHVRDDEARAFYCHHAEFLQSPVDPLHLFLPMKAIASRFQSRAD
jgi:hypothetical protein